MSIASFNMFVGGAVGTTLNGKILETYGVNKIFINASFIILIVGILASVIIAKNQAAKNNR